MLRARQDTKMPWSTTVPSPSPNVSTLVLPLEQDGFWEERNPGQLTVAGGDPILCGRTTKLQTKQKSKVTPLTIGTWNVRTLQDNPSADQPERRTALVARELARFNIDIVALCETRLANEGQLTETGGGYTFFWCGRSSDEHRESGVGFVVQNHLVPLLASLPKGVNDRLMTMQLLLPRGKQVSCLTPRQRQQPTRRIYA
ncbi:Craniofacial development protein 2 [Varanus komodoensis]|nr:Craniofacial development protein 2 [Varanus komodoensis]